MADVEGCEGNTCRYEGGGRSWTSLLLKGLHGCGIRGGDREREGLEGTTPWFGFLCTDSDGCLAPSNTTVEVFGVVDHKSRGRVVVEDPAVVEGAVDVKNALVLPLDSPGC